MVELYEKDVPQNDRKAVEGKISKKLSDRVSRRLIGLNENREKNVEARMGLAFLGAIGWYVPLPTVAGGLIGRWLDAKYPQEGVSWALNLILIGLIIGVIAAGQWLKREGIDRAAKDQKIRNEQLAQIQSEIGLTDQKNTQSSEKTEKDHD